MLITVKYTGMIQVRLDTAQETFNFPGGEEISLADLIDAIKESHGDDISGQIASGHIAIIDDGDGHRTVQVSDEEVRLSDGDEVLFMRPFAGG